MPWLRPFVPANHLRIVAQRSPSAEDWVDHLLDMLHEEMNTGGIPGCALKVDSAGHAWMTVEGYGLRSADPDTHQRLRGSTRPDGLHAGGRRRFFRLYVLEWALDEVEGQLSRHPAADRQADRSFWHLTSTDGAEVTVRRTDHDHDCDLLATLTHRLGRQTATRRLSQA